MRLARAVVLCVLCLSLACACTRGEEDVMLGQAEGEYAKGNYLKAESLYERYLEANPQGQGRWEAWDRLAEISSNVLGDQRKAASIMEAAFLEFSDDPDRASAMLWRLAHAYTDLRDWDKATEAWNRLAGERQPAGDKLWEVYWNLGKIHQFQGRYDQARDSMQSCMEAAPGPGPKAQCMYELAQAYTFLNNRDQAKDWLQRLLEMPEADEELKALAAYLLAEVAAAEGRTARARELLESIRQTYPNPKVVESRLQHLESGD